MSEQARNPEGLNNEVIGQLGLLVAFRLIVRSSPAMATDKVSLRRDPMKALTKTSILAAALFIVTGVAIVHAMPRDKLLDELTRSGSIVTTHGILGAR